VSEFDFEMRLCARLESGGYPGDGNERTDPVVARQLGGAVHQPGSRVVDVVLVDPGPDFEQRTAITPETIPDLAIRADVPVGRAVTRRKAFAGFDVSPERQRAVIERAAEIGFFERERRDGRELVRQAAPYPDWYAGLTAIENKPDLSHPGDLDRQLRFDVALSLFDRVVLATGSYVTRVHLNRLPDPVGVWRLRDGEIEVIREPEGLAHGSPAVEIVGERPGRTDVVPVTAAGKTRARRRIAERAYGKGWRPSPPACVHAAATADGRPRCAAFGRVVDPGSDCTDCPNRELGDTPDVDREGLRADRTAWVAEPDGGPRRQAGLDRFS